MKNIFIVGTFLFTTSSFAQNNTIQKIESVQTIYNAGKKSALMQATFIGTFQPVEYNEKFAPVLSTNPVEETDGYILDKSLEAEKQKWTKLKDATQNASFKSEATNSATDMGTISIRSQFEGGATGSCPPDNSLAISKDGLIMSVTNSGIRVYDSTGSLKKTWTLANFVNNSSISSLCDTKVLYDDIEDRFVFYIQSCDWPKASKIILAFSKTNDPAGLWNLYTLDGDPILATNMFDYPKMALNANELILTGNLFSPSGSPFQEAIIFQINKRNGFEGKTLNFRVWNGIEAAPFTLLPLRNGMGGHYGNKCYLVAVKPNTGNQILVYTLTDSMSSPSVALILNRMTISSYGIMGNSSQKGTTAKLHTGDCRAQDGFLQDSTIHFVHNVGSSGWSIIRYYRFNINTLVGGFKTISEAGLRDNVYPAIAPLTKQKQNQAALVSYLSSNSTSFPEIRATYVDHDFNIGNSFLVRKGDGVLNNIGCFDSNKGAYRWGDYSGSCYKTNSDVPSIWISGCYGSTSNQYNTYIAEITDSFPKMFAGVQKNTDIQQSKLYPIPTSEKINVSFNSNMLQKLNFSIYNASGQMVDQIMDAYVTPGKNMFTFQTGDLPKGIYFLNISKDQKIIKHEKFIVE